jgi:TPR repeat
MRHPTLGVVAIVLLAACQATPASHAPSTRSVSPAEQVRVAGDEFMAKGDYAKAVEKFREAADLDPAAIAPRFALGTAYSFLEKRPEAVAQFRWVLASAEVTSTEYQEAHRWLVRVGALPVAAPSDTTRQRNETGTSLGLNPSVIGRIVGKTEWPDVTPQRRLVTGHLSLVGDEPTTQDVNRSRPFRLGDAYEFRDLPAGRYRVIAVIDETAVWDEKVTVEAGRDTNLNLTASTSPVPVEKFSPEATPGNGEGSGAPRPR